MINLHRAGGRIAGRVVGEHSRSRRNVRGLDEGLLVEDAGKVTDTSSVGIRLDVSLIPRQPEWALRYLDQEGCELGFRRHVENFNVHVLHRPKIADGDAATGIYRKA